MSKNNRYPRRRTPAPKLIGYLFGHPIYERDLIDTRSPHEVFINPNYIIIEEVREMTEEDWNRMVDKVRNLHDHMFDAMPYRDRL